MATGVISRKQSTACENKQTQKSQNNKDPNNAKIEALLILNLESKSSNVHVFVRFERDLWQQTVTLTATSN